MLQGLCGSRADSNSLLILWKTVYQDGVLKAVGNSGYHGRIEMAPFGNILCYYVQGNVHRYGVAKDEVKGRQRAWVLQQSKKEHYKC